MPEVFWDDSPVHQPLQPFDTDPTKIDRAEKDDQSLWNPAKRLGVYSSVIGAGIRLENPVHAANELLMRPTFDFDPEFDWNLAANESPAFQSHPESFIYAASQDEWNFIEQKHEAERADREALFANGTGLGLLGGVVGGVLSPTVLIPLMGPSKGIRGVTEAFSLAAIASGADELILQANQDLRTWEESGLNIAAGTVLGGLLGSAAVHLRTNGEKKIINELNTVFRNNGVAEEVIVNTGSINAASSVVNVGSFKRGRGVFRDLFRTNPHGRLVTDRGFLLNEATGKVEAVDISPTGQNTAATITDNGLKMEGVAEGRAPVPGGTVEARISQHNAPLGQAVMTHQSAYAKYLAGTAEDVNALQRTTLNMRGGVKGLTPKGKMTAKEFGEEINKSLNTGGKHEIPEVQEAVNAYREMSNYVERINEQYFNEAKELLGDDARRLFNPFKDQIDEVTGETTTFWHHMYDPEKIQGSNFDDWVQTRVELGMKDFFKTEQAKYTKQVARFENELAGQGITGTKAYNDLVKVKAREIKDLKAQIKKLDEGQAKKSMERQLAEEEQNLSLTKSLAEGENEAGLNARLIDELYESLEEISGAKITKRGGIGVNVRDGTADFSEISADMANHLAHKIRGSHFRIAGSDILQAKRGPALQRMLHDKYEVKSQFLINDPDIVSRSYMRQIGPDLELHRAFGSVNASDQFAKIQAEYDRFIRKVEASGVQTKGRVGRRVSKATKGRVSATKAVPEGTTSQEVARLRKQQKRAADDLKVLIDRLRHQRGIPENADSVGYRAGRTFMNANVPLMMGMVLPSSLQDASRTLFKFHAKNIIGDGALRKIANPELYAMQADQLKLAGGAWDSVMHTRPQALFDIYNASLAGGSKFERGVEWAANKTGAIALFEQWTIGWKNFTANVATGEISRGIRAALTDSNISKADKTMYKEMQASLGFTPDLQRRIWKQLTETPNGGTQVGDNWLPNLEAWDDIPAAMAYKAGLAKMAEFDTIITPGVAKPAWMDRNMAFRMVAQFRSFTDASMNKTLLATIQDASLDMNGMRFLMAASMSLGLGMGAWYMKAAATGGDVWERAKKASLGTAIDEGIDNSGLLGWFAEGMRALDLAAPAGGFHRFGEQGVTRRSASGFAGMALGPSFGTAGKMVEALQGIDEPTESTIHRARQLTFWNQVFWARRMMNALEESVVKHSGVPESRR